MYEIFMRISKILSTKNNQQLMKKIENQYINYTSKKSQKSHKNFWDFKFSKKNPKF